MRTNSGSLAVCLAALGVSVVCLTSAFGQTDVDSDLELLAETPLSDNALSITDTRRLRAAERVLAADSSNPAALTELGRHHAAGYRWYANMIRTKQPIGGGLRSSRDRELNNALRFLEAAYDASDGQYEPASRERIRLLIEDDRLDEAELLVREITRMNPDSPQSWLLRGLVSQMRDRPDRAERAFELALDRMHEPEADLFVSTAEFLVSKAENSDRDKSPREFDEAFWVSRDPLYLTPENERLSDHYARMVYADIWYGTSEIPGWSTERGQIVVRYGIPRIDMTFTGVLSRFNVLDFGDFDFVFEDQTRGGHYTLYSPKAGAGSSWAFDYVIRAGEMERSLPERFRFNRIPEVPVDTRIARFKGGDGKTDLYVQYAVPLEDYGLAGFDLDPRSRIGGFVTGSGGAILLSEETSATGTFRFRNGRRFEVGAFGFTLDAGRYRSSLEFFNNDRSAFGAIRDSLVVETWPAGELLLSDIVVASEVDLDSDVLELGGRIQRNGFTLTPDPWARIRADQEALVYLEVYGLTLPADGSGAEYRLDAIVEEKPDRGAIGDLWSFLTGTEPKGVSISSVTRSDSSTDRRFLALDLSSQRLGKHVLTVAVRDLGTGATASTSREILIVGPGE